MRTILVLCAEHILKNYRLTMKTHLPDGSHYANKIATPPPKLPLEFHTIQSLPNPKAQSLDSMAPK